MLELAPSTVWAVELLVESLAWPGFVVFRDVCFLVKFPGSVGERAAVAEIALACQFPVPADLCLILNFETFLVPV